MDRCSLEIFEQGKIRVNTERHFLEAGGIQIEIVRKAIKHLRLGVYPPSGRRDSHCTRTGEGDDINLPL